MKKNNKLKKNETNSTYTVKNQRKKDYFFYKIEPNFIFENSRKIFFANFQFRYLLYFFLVKMQKKILKIK